MGMVDYLFSRRNFLQGILGINARRNLYEVFGYSTNPDFDNRFAKYLRQDVAARIVDAPAAALWTNPPQVSSTDATWQEAWDDLVARFDLFTAIERADKLAGIGRYSVIVVGFNDGNGLEMPVSTSKLARRDQKVLFLQVYSERSAKIESYVTDTASERFNKPAMYMIHPDLEKSVGFNNNSRNRSAPLGSFKVHASRVLHIAENVLENDVFGSPRMERVYNILDDLLKVTGGSAETFWLTANRGLHIDVDKELEMEPEDEAGLSAEVDEYSQGLRRVMRTRGVKVNSLGSDTPDPTGVFKVLISCLSGATGIPSRILIGSEAGQLASEQDRANWADRIDERRATFGNTMILHQLLKMLFKVGYFDNSVSMTITVLWPSAFKMSPLEAAQTSAQHARSATNFAKAISEMHTLNTGTPGSEGVEDPETGAVSGGTPAVPGANLGDLITIDEARAFIGLDKPPVTFNSSEDLRTFLSGRARKVVCNVAWHVKNGYL